MLLEVKELDVAYGAAKVLHGVSLAVDDNEMVFIVGRNGAGKTTLLKTTAGFMAPIAGSIAYAGESCGGTPAEAMALKGIRYVFQDKRVFSQLTVRENIELSAYMTPATPTQAVEKVLEIYPRMAQFLESRAGGLSGGQRQLLLLGCALIGEPRLLLIDEPTEGLAAGTIAEVFEVLQSVKGRVSMLIVEQNLDVVRRLADRVYAMKEGHIPREFRSASEFQEPDALEQYL